MTLSLTSLADGLKLNAKLFASDGSECLAGFYYPKCPGITVFSQKIDSDYLINAHTMLITSSAFSSPDSQSSSLLVYVTADAGALQESEATVSMFF